MKQCDTTDLGVHELPLKSIVKNPLQPRQTFKEEAIKELAESIRYNGLLQPIVVRKLESNYIIIAGERRYRAHLLLNAETIKAKVIVCDDSTAYELTLLENIQREDLMLLEEARGYAHLKNEYNYSLDDLVRVASKSKSSISNILSILNEPVNIQKYSEDGTLTIAAYVWIKQLPNAEEKVLLLEKLRREEIKRTHIRSYVERVVSAYKMAEDLKLNPRALLERTKRKGTPGRFDILNGVIPEDFKFHFIVDFNIESVDLPFLPTKNILLSAYNFMNDKTAAKRLALILLERKNLGQIICDSGSMPAARKENWDFLYEVHSLIKFYELIKPTACVSLDVPLYPFVTESWKIPIEKMQKITLDNALTFLQWKPSFSTIKILVLQGENSRDYISLFLKYRELNAFDCDNVTFGFGGLATKGSSYQEEIICDTMSNKEVKKVLPSLPFIHAFGIGDPKRILTLYKYGVNSFDSLSSIILSATGNYWLRDNSKHVHIIHESPSSRKIRLYFNMHSFWGMLSEEFAKYRGIPLSKEKRSILLPQSH